MRKITIKKIQIENFKGIADATIVLNGESKEITLPYGTGKTTIYEAFLWCLGISTNSFEPCHRIENTWQKIDGLTTSVSLELIATENGSDLTYNLSRVNKGGVNKFTLDEKAIGTLKAYQKQVCNIMGCELNDDFTLKDMLSLGEFNSKEWVAQRKTLMALANVDTKVRSQYVKYPLISDCLLKRMSTEEIGKALNKQLKDIDKKKTAKNAEIGVIENEMLNYQLDYEKLGKDLETVKKRIAEIDEQLTDYTKLQEEFAQATIKKEQARVELDLLIKAENTKVLEYTRDISKSNARLVEIDEEINFTEGKEFNENAVCPYCGRELNFESKAKALENFEKEKENKLKSLREERIALKSRIETLDKERALTNKNMVDKQFEFDRSVEKLGWVDLRNKTTAMGNANILIIREKESLDKKANDLRIELAKEEQLKRLNLKANDMRKELLELCEEEQGVLERKEELKKYSQDTRKIVEDTINSYFEDTNITYQLYSITNDGTLNADCICMWQGRSYDKALSRGERLLADYELINILQQVYDLSLPIFVDNLGDIGETQLDTVRDVQVITLKTGESKEDKNVSIISVKEVY